MWFVNSEVGRIKQKIIICTACEVKVENSWKLIQAILGSKQAEWLACRKSRDPILNAVLLFSKTVC